VDDAPPDAQRVAGPDLDRLPVDGERDDAPKAVDRLLEGVVAMRCGHLGVGWDVALEHGDARVGVLGLDEETDAERAEGDRLCGCGFHAGPQLERIGKVA
jgi:hypothetical protein